MPRSWLAILPIIAAASSVQAQYTPEQRAQHEAEAVRTTIGDTRQRQEIQFQEADPLRGLRCGGVSASSSCSNTLRGTYYLPQRWPGEAGGTAAAPRGTFTGRPDTGPQGIHFAAFGNGIQRSSRLHPLGTLPVSLAADRPSSLTLASPIGGPGRTLMIHTAVRLPGEDPAWSWMREAAGDKEGRYLVPVPSIAPGTYELLVEVYDLERPLVPYSVSRTTLNVK